MYQTNYGMPRYSNQPMYRTNQNGDRFIAGGVVAPLLLGGVAGYALGTTNRPNYYYPQPYYYYPMAYSNNYYYYNPYYY